MATLEATPTRRMKISTNHVPKYMYQKTAESQNLPGVDYDIVSQEDLDDYREAMEALERGEYYVWDPNVETHEAFIERTRQYV